MQGIIDFLKGDNFKYVITALFLASEALGGIASIKQSSVYQVVFDVVKWVYNTFVPKKELK